MPLKFFDKLSRFYDFIETYILKDYQGSETLLDQYLHLDPADRVVDIGGGTGHFSKIVQPHVAQVVLVDPSRHMLLKNRLTGILSIQASGEAIGLKNTIFSIALMINTLHHIPVIHHKSVFEEINRILQPNGTLCIIEVYPDASWIQHLFIKLERLITGPTHHIQSHILQTILESTGFHVQKNLRPPHHNWKYLIIATKK
ncbi:MAG: class I SAM-dependent methyltransferase [Candidatus Thermoplasmatota archaeon]|nr:class I SAM-dependent methyltransferase [Candidatus Thermoplasmatota archaeon]MBU1940694.1 class I SAM-dependent methyltransferase [Candidatus Thermoplasmatota archaeon]